MEVDATPRWSKFESHTQHPQLCFVSRTMSLTSNLGGTRGLASTLGGVPQKLVYLNIFVHISVSLERWLGDGPWSLSLPRLPGLTRLR